MFKTIDSYFTKSEVDFVPKSKESENKTYKRINLGFKVFQLQEEKNLLS